MGDCPRHVPQCLDGEGERQRLVVLQNRKVFKRLMMQDVSSSALIIRGR